MAPTALYTSQNLTASPPRRVLADLLLLLQGKLQLPATLLFFFSRLRAYYGQMSRHGRTGTASPTPNPNPVNLLALSHARGAVTGRGQGGRSSR